MNTRSTLTIWPRSIATRSACQVDLALWRHRGIEERPGLMATPALTEEAAAPRARLFGRITLDRENLIMLAVGLLVAYITVVPLAVMIWFSIRTNGPAEVGGTFTLNNYIEAYLNPTTYLLLGNTFLFAGGSTILGMVLGVGFAWIVERTNVPGRTLAYVMVPLSAATPGVLFGIAWVLLLSPRIGVYNLPFTQWLGWETAPFQPYSLLGMIVVESMRISATVFLMVIGLFRSMDPSLEEAASSAGVGTFQTLRRVTLPILLPGMLAVLIYISTSLMGAFEIPAILGMPEGIYVFSTRIWVATHKLPRDYGLAGSLAMLFTAIGIIGILVYHRVLRVQQRFATVTGKAFRPRVLNLGRWKYLGTFAILFYFTFAILGPMLILVWASLQPFYQIPSGAALANVSLDAYKRLFTLSWMVDAVKNTLLLVLIVPTVTMGLSAFLSWMVVRSKAPGRKILDTLAFLPHTMPSIVIGLALMWLYLSFDVIPIYGTIWIINLAMITQFLAFGSRTTNAAMYQLHKDLEEAGAVGGASWFDVFRKITIPLLVPSLVSGWIWVAIHAVRELTAAVMLGTPQTRVLSVLIWNFWETGDVAMTAAAGILLSLFVASLLLIGRIVSQRSVRQT
jgi:iron(III) transport system permease protein